MSTKGGKLASEAVDLCRTSGAEVLIGKKDISLHIPRPLALFPAVDASPQQSVVSDVVVALAPYHCRNFQGGTQESPVYFLSLHQWGYWEEASLIDA